MRAVIRHKKTRPDLCVESGAMIKITRRFFEKYFAQFPGLHRCDGARDEDGYIWLMGRMMM